MRFLIPNFCPPDTFVDNVSHTLKAMGHEVVHLGVKTNAALNSPYRRLFGEVVQKLTGNNLSYQEKWLKNNLHAIRPDVVLCLTQSLSPETLGQIRSYKIHTVSWWGDTAANMNGRGLLADGWDLIFIKDSYAATKLRMIGLPAFQLYEAMNPSWHKPLKEQTNNRVVIAGSFYDYRHYLVAKLLKEGISLDLYGGKLPRWADKRVASLHSGKFIVREEKSRVFGEGLAVLNSTAMSEFDSVNCRAFEAAGCGALQIMEYRPAIESCFEPGKEILLYKSFGELIELLSHAEKHPQEMKKIREAAARRAIAEHTYKHRLELILKKINELR
jgi:spore maturation protein CgeB